MTSPATTGSVARPAGTPRGVRTARVATASTVLEASGLLQPVLPTGRFLDRELSWLAVNERVRALAKDPDLPLLERARFLAIFASNLDEVVRGLVAGLKRRIATGLAVTAASGLEPRQVLDRISEKAHQLQKEHSAVYNDMVAPALAEAGIALVHWNALAAGEQERLHAFFRDQVFPVLTPLAVDPA